MIVTMGEQGAVYAEMDGESGICPATRVEVQDTTGAGDAFFRRGRHRPHLRQDAGSVLRHRQPSGGLRHLHQQQRLPPVPAGGVRAGRHCDGMRAGT